MTERIAEYFRLEEALLAAERRGEALTEELKLARCHVRQYADQKLQYEGSLRSFLDRLKGRQEQRQENLDRQLRHAEGELASLTREKEALTRKQTGLREALSALPNRDALRDQAMTDPETGKTFAAMEARSLCRRLQPLLAEAEQALLEYRKTMRGSRAGEILSYEELHAYGTAPNEWGRKCAALLEWLKEDLEFLDVPFTVGPWFSNPEGYVAAAAAKHNRLDRLNDALDQVAATKKTVSGFLSETE